ncbi:SCP2 sterol-binding domain-containing protein [Siculibacillus lacustris]|uniref:SCP2 sterol-binding domain-containing protein n=1 Tax=Siculibacillus lacustris TaxID=1549641 RepID=A0A4Q9VJA9_9HYPH|nr:SCP2 sterol-binding domain-containing protein [Siculibacillus lacustris]TBW35383.1 SCP2 sterol-binding domain-containing protein [Siculibacillus lacustris]
MDADDLEDRLQATLPALDKLRAVVRFDLGSDGSTTVDARESPARFTTDEDVAPDCTIKISSDNLAKLLDGKLDPMLGYTLGKIKVVGSLGVAMKLIGAIG